MKLLKSVFVLATFATCVSANAADLFGKRVDGTPYVGVKIGKMDYNGKVKPTTYGVYGGYYYDANISAELEYIGSETGHLAQDGLNVAAKGRHYGVYGGYRYNFEQSPIYVKGKLGLVNSEIKVKDTNRVGNEDKLNSTGIAFGANVGYQATPNFSVDLGYTHYPHLRLQNQNLIIKAQGVDLGATYRF